MNDRGSTCKFRNARSAFRNLHVDPFFHTSMRNKQVEFNPYIYTLSKLSRFGYEISVFKYTAGRYSEQPGRYSEQPAHTYRLSLHGKMNVKIFLMFIVAENTRSVNISNSSHCSFTILSRHTASALIAVKDHVIKYSEIDFSNNNYFCP